MGDYHDHDLKRDVLLLTDAFEKFISTCLGLKQNQNLFQTMACIFLIEEGMRGGISYIAKRYSKVNNKCMKDYYSSEESKLIIQMQTIYMIGQ